MYVYLWDGYDTTVFHSNVYNNNLCNNKNIVFILLF